MQIAHQYVKQRKDFGRHPSFTDGGAVVSHPSLSLPFPAGVIWPPKPKDPGEGWTCCTCVQMLADIRPNEEHARNFAVCNPMSSAVQVGPEMSEHEVRCMPAACQRPSHHRACERHWDVLQAGCRAQELRAAPDRWQTAHA